MKKKWQPTRDGLRIELVDTTTGEVLESPKTRYGSKARIREAIAAGNREIREQEKTLSYENLTYAQERTIVSQTVEQHVILHQTPFGVLDLLTINTRLNTHDERETEEGRAHLYLSGEQAEELGYALLTAGAKQREIDAEHRLKFPGSNGGASHLTTAEVEIEQAEVRAQREAEKKNF